MARFKGTEGATRRLFIRITDGEKAIIKDQAKRAGLTMSEYMRRTSLHKRIVSKMDQKALVRKSGKGCSFLALSLPAILPLLNPVPESGTRYV